MISLRKLISKIIEAVETISKKKKKERKYPSTRIELMMISRTKKHMIIRPTTSK
jgi:hypothetical protein